MLLRSMFLSAVLVASAVLPAAAKGIVPFDRAWTEQRFPFLSSNSYGRAGARLEVASQGTVSLIWRALPDTFWSARAARWTWQVNQGVAPTDLRQKGGDDRNLALYFVFLPVADARALGSSPNIRTLLNAKAARVLVYVWGGTHGRGDMLDSPYLGARGKTVVLRPAGTGAHSESIDLARDHVRAFGTTAEALVGIAVSADSDDTDGRISAAISSLQID